MQYSQRASSNGDPLVGGLALLAEHPSEAAVEALLGDMARVVGARNVTLSPGSGRAEDGVTEVRVPIMGTSRHLVAIFGEPPSSVTMNRLHGLASAASLALRLASREHHAERSRSHVTLGRAVAGVLHDVANPLHTLLLNLEAAREGVGVNEAIDDALQSGRLMQTALDRLRRFTGGMAARPSAVDVGAAIAAALRVSAFETRGLAEVAVRVAPGLFVFARAGELEHVLVNLVVNAAHALAGIGGLHHRITVSAFARRNDVIIEVQDTGPGISPEHLARVFDEGFTTKATRSASGLGLTLCRDIVTKLGGTIEVAAPHESGTRVSVRLPSASPKHDAGEIEEEMKALPHVLVVDGDELVARSLGRALGPVATVTTRAAIEDALPLIDSERFDLILCEHAPPRMDGLLLRRQHALRWPQNAAQVVLAIVDPYIELPPGTRVITKPLAIGALKALVAEMTARSPSAQGS